MDKICTYMHRYAIESAHQFKRQTYVINRYMRSSTYAFKVLQIRNNGIPQATYVPLPHTAHNAAIYLTKA